MNSFVRYLSLVLVALASWLPLHVRAQTSAGAATKAMQLQELLKKTPQLPLERVAITIQPPSGKNGRSGESRRSR